VRHQLFRIASVLVIATACSTAYAQQSFRGFDRNDYPGDAALPGLKKSFEFTGYSLNNPLGEKQSSWAGKRAVLKKQALVMGQAEI
jgi:hypothetical protein